MTPKLVTPPRRMVAVVWRDAEGNVKRQERPLRFLPGFGHFVTWRGRALLVEDLELAEMRLRGA